MKRIFAVLLFIPVIFSCNNAGTNREEKKADLKDTLSKEEGVTMIPVQTPLGTFKVWTKKSGDNPRIKILLLHGGPAATHEYMECFRSFFPKEGFEFYEYDQLGSYNSDKPADSSLWTLDRFVDEVEQVRKAIGAGKDNFFLLGNSWGGLLGMEYALKYQDNMKGLIVCNMMASIPRYAAYGKKLRTTMRRSAVDSLMNYESKAQYEDSNYLRLLQTEFYDQHICRLQPWPEPVTRSFGHINYPIYLMMQGPSEFSVGGRLLNWDRWNDLKQIYIPTLMVGAKFDTMDPEDMKKQSEMVQHGRYLYCPNGSHLAMWDDQQVFMNGVIQFIKDVDGGGFKK
jgi:proline iminopeptidase